MNSLVASRDTAAPDAADGVVDQARAVTPGLVALALVALASTWIASLADFLSPLVVGVVLGALVVNVAALPPALLPGVRFASRSVLRFGIVLLGFRLSLGDLAGLGASGLLVVACVVTVTFVGTRWVARRLGIPDDLGLLVATGYSICGASAIAAMDGVIDADEEETAYAITLVTLCGTLSIFVLPLLAGPLGLGGEMFGAWVGGAVHDVGQVVATASTEGDGAVAAATVVKLTRVVLLAPLVATIAITRRRAATGAARNEADGAADPTAVPDTTATGGATPPLVPLFVVGFLVAIVVRSTGVLGDGVLDTFAGLEKIVLTIALVGLGMGVRFGDMRRLGARPLVLGLVAWVLVAGAAYLGTEIAL
ncbi:putative sulfate exporter family transporter [Ilumatobacter sp.]|uniref:YeiH family protein n=1 Tax=Ilumatobacter sp. TaxID=1967498 RepID=UPI003299309F